MYYVTTTATTVVQTGNTHLRITIDAELRHEVVQHPEEPIAVEVFRLHQLRKPVNKVC